MNKAKAIGWTVVYVAALFGIILVISVIFTIASLVVGTKMGILSYDAYANFVEQIVSYAQQGTPLMILNFAQEIIMLACFGMWYYFREKRYHYRPNYKKVLSLKNILRMIGTAFFGQYASNLIVLLAAVTMPGVFEDYLKTIQTLDINAGNPFIMVFCVVFFGPLVEEIVFRGMIFGKMRRAFSFWPSALVSGILFGIFHLNLVQGLYATVFGVVLAYIFEKTETLWGCYILHALFNLWSYIISGYETALSHIGIELPNIAQVVIGVISLGIVVVLLRQFGKMDTHTKDSPT
jgi:hypothetical protein